MLRKLLGRASEVAVGTALGQGLVVLATPYLARQYSPAEFGVLALLMTVSNISIGAACLRYDLAIPSAGPSDVRGLLVTAVGAALASTGLAGGLLLILPHTGQLESVAVLVSHPLLFAACVGLAGLYQATNAWFLQRGAFRAAAGLRLSQGAGFSALAFVPGVGLLWAHVMSFAAGLLSLRRVLVPRHEGEVGWREVAIRHRHFPLMSLPGALLDVCGYSLAIWVIATFYGQATAGNYSQIQRLTGAPMMLLSISLAQILLKQNAELSDDSATLLRFFRRLLQLLSGVSVMGLVGLWLCGEPILRSWLGPQWQVDRDFIVVVALAVFVRATVSPLSTVLITLQRFGLGLTWQVTYFCSALLLMPYVAGRVDFSRFVWFYAAHECVLYGAYLVIIHRAIRLGKKPADRR